MKFLLNILLVATSHCFPIDFRKDGNLPSLLEFKESDIVRKGLIKSLKYKSSTRVHSIRSPMFRGPEMPR